MVDSVFGFGKFFFEIHDLFDLHQKPPVYFGQAKDFFNRESSSQRMTDEKDSLGIRDGEFSGNHVTGENVSVSVNFCSNSPRFAIAAQAAAANLQRAQTFL